MSADLTVPRYCPSCGGSALESPPEVRSRISPDTLSVERLGSFWGVTSRNDCFFDYRRCGSCGLLHNSTYLRPDLVANFYSQMDDNTAGVPRPLLEETQRRYLAALEEFAPLAGVYLEVGPDIGLAAEIAIEGGDFTKVVLVEPNQVSRSVLQQSMHEGMTVVVDSLAELDESIRVDCLVLIHVLDHLVNPREDLVGLRRRMMTGGMMVAVVHDESSLLRRLLGRCWPPFQLQHPQLFSGQTLTDLLESCGFTVRSLRATTNTLSLRHLVRLGFSALGGDPGWTVRVPQTRFRVRLGNILVVAEAK